ncbi:MAG: MBL fold hydrolase [Rhodobacteraceae bacterium]|nr:MBL fold hydrolase [Paracoccaceae bacterium]
MKFPNKDTPKTGKAIEVANDILWMRLPLPMALDHVNVYAIREKTEECDGWTLIDTGFDTKKSRSIWEELLKGPLLDLPIKRVIVTHHHPDHVGLAGWFQSKYASEIWASRTTWLFARMMTLDRNEKPSKETLNFYKSAGMDKEILEQRSKSAPFNFSDVVAPIALGFRRLQQDETIRIGKRSWKIHMGNGHSPEHSTLWSIDDDIVIAGDQILPSISPNLGVYATEPEADPVGEWLESCERLLLEANNDQLVLPGHKLPFYGLPNRLTQLIENHHEALERLSNFLITPKTAAQCFEPLYRRKINSSEYGLALVESIGHLNHLLKEKKVIREKTIEGIWLWKKI